LCGSQEGLNMEGIERIIELTGGRFLRKVKWDQCWHLLKADPRPDPWHISWRRISIRQAGGYIRHKPQGFRL